jgi:hypothetical protein
VERGRELHFPEKGESLEERILNWIRMLGPANVFGWIRDIALAVEELESLGIYHADLAFRNTIKVAQRSLDVFKVIDFDKAFKVFPTEAEDRVFEFTRQLLDFWLRFDGSDSNLMQEKSDSEGSRMHSATYNER